MIKPAEGTEIVRTRNEDEDITQMLEAKQTRNTGNVDAWLFRSGSMAYVDA